MTRRVVIQSKAADGTNEANLATTIAAALAPEFDVKRIGHTPGALIDVMRSDLLIVHSSTRFSLVAIVLAKFLRRPITAVVWDLYPVTISGRRYDNRLGRKLADVLERLALWMADHLVVQTEDFRASPALARAQVIPFWYVPSDPATKESAGEDDDDLLEFAFAGQINRTRGLEETVVDLDQRLSEPASLHIYSRDPFDPPKDLKRLQVHHHGPLAKDDVVSALQRHDVGLISLNPGFDGPAFPSKSLDYLAAGLPIIYFGPALPHFSNSLTAAGCGVVATSLDKVNPALFKSPTSRYKEARNAFFNRVRADPDQLKRHCAEALRNPAHRLRK